MIFNRDYVRDADREYRKGKLEKAARLYEKAKRYEQSATIYKELGEIDKAVAVYDKNSLPMKAAELLEAEGRYRDAIGRYESAGSFRKAAEASLELRQVLRAGRYFEQAEMYERAAECFTTGGEVERALRVLEKHADELRQDSNADHINDKRLRKLDRQRADLLRSLGREAEAAQLLFDSGFADQAAPIFESLKDFAAAAAAYLEAGDEATALKAIDKAPDADPELRAEIFLNCAKPLEAGEIFEQLGKLDAAATAYGDAGEYLLAAVLWEKLEAFNQAAELYHLGGQPYDGARCFAKAGEHLRAAKAFAAANAHRNAADAYLNADQPLLAAEEYLEAELETEAQQALVSIELDDPDYARASLLLLPLIVTQDGYEETASHRLQTVKKSGSKFERYELFYCQGRIHQAKRRHRDAAAMYQKVLVEQPGYRDVSARLAAVKSKLASEDTPSLRDTGRIAVAGPKAMKAAGLPQLSEQVTQRVRMKPSSAKTGPVHAEDSSAGGGKNPSGVYDLPILPEVPMTDTWWQGANFYVGTDQRSDDKVYIVSFPMAEIGDRVDGFRQVMRQVKALRHHTILRLEETQLASDKVVLYYEHFAGVTLGEALAQGRKFSPLESLRLIIQLCEALIDAHKLGVTHQWLSTRTVLVDEKANCKMVGIGLREFLASNDSTSSAYLSPEVLKGGVIGPTSDIYSLGWLAMELLGAQMPASGSAKELTAETVGWSEEVKEAVPSSLRGFLVRCLAQEPLDRPSTAEMTAALSSIGFLEGQLLSGRYEILGELGQGGMSRVYRALDRDLGDVVAIKTVLTPALGRTEDEERLLREVQISRRITHTNVVRVHDIGRFPGGIFIIMELLDGPGLDDVIRDEAPLKPERVRKVISEIASALGEAHRLKIIHRDLKPGNVILVDERVKVLDFGIARMSDGNSPHLTRTGEVIGSPLYMAPEQIQGLELTGTCDLYALGVIAFTLLAGREPFSGDSPTAVVLQHLHDPPPNIREFQPKLPQEWIEVLARLLAKKTEDRYQTAEELIEALDRLPG